MVFEGLGLIGNFLILLASIISVIIASDVTISNSVKLSNITGFGKTTIGFILVGFATSLPELSVTVFGVTSENIGVSIGNVLGSNIVDIALVLGVCFLIVAVKCPRFQCMYPAMAKEEIGNLYFGPLYSINYSSSLAVHRTGKPINRSNSPHNLRILYDSIIQSEETKRRSLFRRRETQAPPLRVFSISRCFRGYFQRFLHR